MDNRARARQIFDAGVAAADPEAAVTRHLSGPAPALILAIGKAAGAMARAALQVYPGVPALVVTNYENAVPLDGADVMAAGHPVPDANGLAAGQRVMSLLAQVQGRVLVLVSGGGSALLPAPAAPVTLADKAALNALLLGAGLDIRAMNVVRQHVSALKGGGLLRHAQGPVQALILSDVVGDDLAVIASGPTVAPIGSKAEAVAVLQEAGIWTRVPKTVRAVLEAPVAAQPMQEADNLLVGSNAISVAAMAAWAGDCHVLDPVEGDVAEAAAAICDAAGPGVTLWGGETTVVLKGSGRGGRNQELALRIAVEAQARGWQDWVCLQGGTDGRDGPTDAAGGLVDAGTLGRIGDVAPFLANNDSYAALARAGDLLITGATGTNVADLGVLIRAT